MPKGKLALLVGVDRYLLLKPENQLRSCANDARLMAHLLRERFGFEEEGMTLLLDAEATREAILAGLRDLAVRARPGDSVVFYYSGHGSKVADRDGDEPDGMDETLVPHDSGRDPYPNLDILDDEIHDWILAVSAVTPYLTVIADTCFSGGAARKMPGLREKWVELDCRPRAGGRQGTRGAGAGSRRQRDAGPSGFLPVSDRYALLAACHAGEKAKELPVIPGEREPYSAFTYFLCQELLRASKNATYRDVLERTRIAVAAAVQAQTPQAEGARDRLLFGAEGIEPARYLTVEARNGDRIRLGGGAVHGVDPGSEWGIYPPGTRQAKGGSALGVVRVGEVWAVSAEAEIVREKRPIEAGARAFERSKGPGWMRLGVAIGAGGVGRGGAADLARRIERSPFLRVEEEGRAEARIFTLEGKDGPAVAGVGGAIHLAEASWVVLDQGGALLLPPIPLRQPGAVTQLVEDLEGRARYRNLLRLVDEDEDNPLQACLDIRLLRQSESGEFRPARPEKATGEIVYREGEHLALRIVHHAECPLYLHVLDLGLTGAVGLFYPIAGASKGVSPGHVLEVGVRANEQIRLQIPEAFVAWQRAQAGEEEEGRRLEGKEFVKVFATTEPADLSGLCQSGYGGASIGKRPRGALGSPIWQALGGGGGRRRGAPSAEPSGWTVATQSFLLRGRRGRP